MAIPNHSKTNIEGVIDHDGYLTGFSITNQGPIMDDAVIKFVACGDTGPVRNLENVVLQKGASHVLGELKDILGKADLVFANLEAVFSVRGEPLNRVPVFRLKPESFSLIEGANIKVVSLANNHMFDYGSEAFLDTIELLEKHRISYFGAGLTLNEALKPVIMEVKGTRLGFVGFREKEAKGFFNNGVITPQMNKTAILKSVEKLRPNVDWLILSLHFGWEYQFYPSPRDVKLCRELVDNGVDIILGHHPHYPQGLERYNNGLIIYSLGNFIWDQNHVGHTSASYFTEISLFRNSICSVRIIPFQLTDRYALQILANRLSIDEINSISKVLSNKNELTEKWYFVSRNKVIEAVGVLKNLILNEKKNITKTLKDFIGSPRWKYTVLFFLTLLISGRGVFYEIKRKIRGRGFPYY